MKKQRVSECAASLTWLQEEGMTPVQVVVVNSETSEIQRITLRKDLDQALNLSGEQIRDEDADDIDDAVCKGQIQYIFLELRTMECSKRAFSECLTNCLQHLVWYVHS